jgi:hypothetical protein
MQLRPLVGVRRDRGPRYLFLTIVAFAVTVMAVRVYLAMTGYPKIGGGGLHVAHMLWGGLLLIVAALLLQLFVGRRVLILSSIAAGIGVGLFIDEVGKFITESNDYFFAPAAPLIYGGVLLLVLVWLRVRRDDRPSEDVATQGAIEAIRDLADGRLSEPDRDRAVERLHAAGATTATTGLPGDLLSILSSPDTEARLAQPGWVERGESRLLIRRLLPDRVERILIRIGLFLSALAALLGLLIAIAVLGGQVTSIPDPVGPIEMPTEPVWVLLLALVWVVVGVTNGAALVLSLTGRHPRGMAVAQYAVLIGLVAGGLLNTYVSQLGALSGVVVQLGLLLLILDQRGRLAEVSSQEPAASSTPAIPGGVGP